MEEPPSGLLAEDEVVLELFKCDRSVAIGVA